jgi:hypothetical protein
MKFGFHQDIKSGEAKAAPKLNDKQVAMLLSAA